MGWNFVCFNDRREFLNESGYLFRKNTVCASGARPEQRAAGGRGFIQHPE